MGRRDKVLRRVGFYHLNACNIALILILMFCLSAMADISSAQNINPKEFSSRIVGDWIGICNESVSEKKSPPKCFTLKVSQTGTDSFSSRISYFRKDEQSKKFVACGETTIVTTIAQDKSAKSVITGNGLAFLDKSFKKETHQIVESFKAISPNELEGTGSGTMSVSGIAMNMGKKGKITKTTTTWSVSEDILTIETNMKVKFSFLCFGKSNSIKTTHKAWRGTDMTTAHKKIDSNVN